MGSDLNWAACALVGRMVTDFPLTVTTGMPEASITTPRMMRGEAGDLHGLPLARCGGLNQNNCR